jgi:tRNA(fMet)-specific endonuclease VapC
MILLDSSVLIELFRKKDKQKSFFYQLSQSEDDFAISIITHYEVLRGINDFQEDFWSDFMALIQILPFDVDSSKEAIKIYNDLKKMNKLIDLADILIAATALTHNISLATLNIDHFSRVKGLNLVK